MRGLACKTWVILRKNRSIINNKHFKLSLYFAFAILCINTAFCRFELWNWRSADHENGRNLIYRAYLQPFLYRWNYFSFRMIISCIIDCHKYNKQLRFCSELIFRKIPNSYEETVLHFLFWRGRILPPSPNSCSSVTRALEHIFYIILSQAVFVRSDKPHLLTRLKGKCFETQRKDFLNCAKNPTKS